MKLLIRITSLLIFVLPFLVKAQCVLNLTPNTTQNIICGESVDIVAQGYTNGPALSEDFNAGTLGAGWQSSSAITYANPCGPTLDGTPGAWFGNVPFPREIKTIGFDVSCGGEVCFDLDFADDDPCGGCSDCEDPDLATEGVYFQYSINGGANWVTIFYFEPNNTGTGPYYSWANYCFTIPPGAQTTNTMFQWSQIQASAAVNDHWGIDNVTIQPYNCGGGYYYTWNGVVGDQDTTVVPNVTTDYEVLYTNGFDDTCGTVLTVNVTPWSVYAGALSTNLNCGDCTTLLVDIINNPTFTNPNLVYSWTPTTDLSDPSLQTPDACPSVTTTYTGTIVETNSGCTGTYPVTINVTPADPGFYYSAYDYCGDAASFLPTITGDLGGTFSAVPVGLSLDVNTGEIDPANSVAGVYDVTYQTPNPNCILDSTVTVTINPLPPVDAGVDQTVCDGTAVLLTASGADSYSWDNGVVDGQSFTPANTITYTVTGTDLNGCVNTDQVDVVVVPVDDPTFEYPDGYSYCLDDTPSTPSILGITGGVFSYQSIPAGSNLDLDVNTGVFDPSNSDVGTYEIQYSTAGNSMCPDSTVLTVVVNPNPDANFVALNTMGCEPVTVSFTSNAATINSCLWDFGDGQTASLCGDVSNIYQAGLFDVTLTVTTPEGCQSQETYLEFVDITDQPVANFYPSLSTTSIEFTEVEFTNTSSGADLYWWSFGDGSDLDSSINPVHLFPEVADIYEVWLTAYSANMLCVDSLNTEINILDAVTFYVPNVFTPNGDSHNNIFQPMFFSGFDETDYHMSIYNRWGELLFESYDYTAGWDGTYDGSLVEMGVYIWRIEFGEELNDIRHIEFGHVTVLK
ncbi:gliding motility-associated C-terminal domain-containing protein [Paracrocinitomix mangrovi]|uniref:T9SS type B sorting domain-containing protein n=1 Tax=Paracrocinitomix mangrovi TaxID=2862509 RepID=UPI001C8D623A|nr:gliding motility-associated C-terminal domain-containing protein [Paracrocinitomix mangrovi]UKN01218.1 gliding motility-associated C-terminal domain-containing protein [Paracrocinitomix mangrovi]